MADLKVCFVKAQGCASKLIEWFGGGGFSHVVIRLPSRSDWVIDARSDIVNGIPPGVQQRPVSYLAKYPCLWLAVPATDVQLSMCEAALKSQRGKPYDKDGIVGFALGRLKDRNWADQSAWFCSELAIWAMQDARICPPLALDPPRITPGSAALICGALGARATVF